uniref:Uncharacterized protein n=1 Tax=Glossina brevipalpis TaxID=37001 RepID=A0A1A9VZL2_9MUSC
MAVIPQKSFSFQSHDKFQLVNVNYASLRFSPRFSISVIVNENAQPTNYVSINKGFWSYYSWLIFVSLSTVITIHNYLHPYVIRSPLGVARLYVFINDFITGGNLISMRKRPTRCEKEQ